MLTYQEQREDNIVEIEKRSDPRYNYDLMSASSMEGLPSNEEMHEMVMQLAHGANWREKVSSQHIETQTV